MKAFLEGHGGIVVRFLVGSCCPGCDFAGLGYPDSRLLIMYHACISYCCFENILRYVGLVEKDKL